MQMVTLSKITAPRLQRVVERNVCFQTIDRALQRRILWLNAPAGSGKTTLVASYLRFSRTSCIWYHLDETDVDAATFFQYMSLAVKTLSLQTKMVLPEFTKEHLNNIPSFTARYFGRLFATLAGYTGNQFPLIIVFDNYQDVPAGSPVHDIVGKGLSLMPEGINAIITSRGVPPPEFTGLRQTRFMQFFGWDFFVFTLEETSELVKICTQYEVPEGVVRALHEKTGGWVAGLILAIEGGSLVSSIPRFEGAGTTEVIFDYFAREIFERTESEIQEFLLKTSYLPEFGVSMAGKLTDGKVCQNISALKHRQYFLTEKLTRSGLIFRYHSLFMKFLRNRAKDYFRERESEIIRLAADILEEHGYTEECARLCMETANVEKLGHLILKNAPSMIAGGRRGVLDNWFASLPEEFLRDRPWLLYWKGMHGLSSDPEDSREILAAAYGKFKSLNDTEGMLLTFCAIVDSFVYQWKDFHPLDYWIDEFEELSKGLATLTTVVAPPSAVVETLSPFSSVEIRERVTASIFAALLFRRPGHPDMAYWTAEAEKVTWDSQNNLQRMSIGHNLVLYYLWTGKIFKAGVIVEALSPIATKIKEHTLPGLMFLMAKALYMYYTSQSPTASKIIGEGLKLADESGVHVLDLMFFSVGILNSLAIGESGAAEAYSSKITNSMDCVQCYDIIYYHHVVSLVDFSHGDYLSAVEHGEIAVKLQEKSGCYLLLGIWTYVLAYMLAEAGELDRARYHMARSIRIGTEANSTLPLYSCTLLEALIALYKNDREQFVEKAKAGIAMSKASGMKFMFYFRSPLTRLCKAALDEKIETGYVTEIIRLNNLTPGNQIYGEWSYHLKVYTLGKFVIEKNGNTVIFKGRTRQKPLEMLKAIIAFGGKDVRMEQLSDSLWPEADGDLADVSFRTNLSRLRKMLSDDNDDNDAIVVSGGLISINGDYLWLDVWSLQDIMDELGRVLNGQTDGLTDVGHAEALHRIERSVSRLYERASGLYNGDFLSGQQSQTWSTYLREHLKDKFIRFCYNVGEFYENIKRWDKSIECYKAAAAIDNLREECYRRMMSCYIRAGLHEEALSVYNTCKKILLMSFGINLSREMEALRGHILSPGFDAACRRGIPDSEGAGT
ncbi:MAG: hypothetical protein HQK89_01620 [Nitrospirae bacterium]|nr:hypothetical protein [Nitrospirota bacterium]